LLSFFGEKESANRFKEIQQRYAGFRVLQTFSLLPKLITVKDENVKEFILPSFAPWYQFNKK